MTTPRVHSLALAAALALGAGACGRFTQNEVMQIQVGASGYEALARCHAHVQRMGYPLVDGSPEQGWFRVAVPSTKHRTLFRVMLVEGQSLEIFAEGAHVREGATKVHKRVKRELEKFAREMGAVALVAAVHLR